MKSWQLEEIKKKYTKATDTEKIQLILELKAQIITPHIENFLLDLIKNEFYDKLRIIAILSLKGHKNIEIKNKLMDIYDKEKNENVRLALINILTSMVDKKEEYIELLNKEKSDIIKTNIVRNIVLEELIDNKSIETFLLDIIEKEEGKYTITVALELLHDFLTLDGIGRLETVCRRKINPQLKLIIYNKLIVYAKEKEYTVSYIAIPEVKKNKGKQK